MTALDLRTFRAMGRAMAATNGYAAKQSSAMYPTDGDMIDWMYGRQRIFSFTFELYPQGGAHGTPHYPPDEVIGRADEAQPRGRALPHGQGWLSLRGPRARRAARLYCGPFFDDLEIAPWLERRPGGGDTATRRRWARGDPARRPPAGLGSVRPGGPGHRAGAGPRRGRRPDDRALAAHRPARERPARRCACATGWACPPSAGPTTACGSSSSTPTAPPGHPARTSAATRRAASRAGARLTRAVPAEPGWPATGHRAGGRR